jgi:hypothetical protein
VLNPHKKSRIGPTTDALILSICSYFLTITCKNYTQLWHPTNSNNNNNNNNNDDDDNKNNNKKKKQGDPHRGNTDKPLTKIIMKIKNNNPIPTPIPKLKSTKDALISALFSYFLAANATTVMHPH